jgi:hypothetical protein
MNTILFLSLLLFMIGLYFYLKTNQEGFSSTKDCPDMLIQTGSKIYLYNSNMAKVPGVNPIEFDNLEDYVEFLDWQRKQGIRCPVLYLQKSYNAQGEKVYNIRPSITEPKGGLPPSQPQPIQPTTTTQTQPNPQPSLPTPVPTKKTSLEEKNNVMDFDENNQTLLVDANHNDPPYNNNSYPSYDQSDYYQGKYTPLDKINEKEQHMLYSSNPMDENWGGPEYSQKLIDQGVFKEDEVSIYVP